MRMVSTTHGGAAVEKHRWLILKQLSNGRIHITAGSPCCSSSLFLQIEDLYLQYVCVRGLGYPFVSPLIKFYSLLIKKKKKLFTLNCFLYFFIYFC